jgi:hypothetical protein
MIITLRLADEMTAYSRIVPYAIAKFRFPPFVSICFFLHADIRGERLYGLIRDRRL